ncbi:bifunctional nicotinamide-nucleotide adenylyltransferase/ADP-ribose pyrophosphatase [Xanthomonas phage Xoo-sp13]|nr:bifunctional nicotinamide-nucleotide adenylyltransferase/ADP-ribose pyrophosphatase [Xanthomonas phage Xoo-sp13]
MVIDSLTVEQQARVLFVGAEDFLYSDADWFTNVSRLIRDVAQAEFGPDARTALIALNKDESTYYLNYFKNSMDMLTMREVKVGGDDAPSLSATKIRELYFEGYLDFISQVVTPGTLNFLKEFYKTEAYAELRTEYDDAVAYQKMFENVPYGNTNFLTVDSIVVQSGHVLLIQRKESPGRGLWALPGGHLNNNERFLDGAIRELREETGLKIPEKVLKGSIFHEQVFDHPDRSLRCRVKGKRGRTVTMAFGFKLDDAEKLPRVKGLDDAAAARWIPLEEVMDTMRDQLFEDHWDLIKRFSNLL